MDVRATPLSTLVGSRTARSLAKLGLHTAEDLLRHYPRRYVDPGTPSDIAHLDMGEHVTVMAQVKRTTVRTMRSRGGALLEAIVTDGVRELALTFFAKRPGVLRMHEDKLRAGRMGLFTGTVGEYRGAIQLTHPDYVIVGVDAEDEASARDRASRPLPLYPATAGVPTWRIARAVTTVLTPLREEDLPDPIPDDLRLARSFPSLLESLRQVHAPHEEADWKSGQARLAWEEAWVLQVALARQRASAQARGSRARPRVKNGLLDSLDASLPFPLTEGQRNVGEEITRDLGTDTPMLRLLQGDVGSGKTVVALRAMAHVVDAGGQAALLAPTEVLAMQHERTLRSLTKDITVPALHIATLTGSMSGSERSQVRADIASGAAGIVVGTHALLSDDVEFADLGLVVVDEQHRFGVEQRDRLRTRGDTDAHVLVMTATPIPRTIAMTVFGDLEVSHLTELPAGRAEVQTHLVPRENAAWIARIWSRVREEIDAGRRVYVVCPRIEGSVDQHDAAGAPSGDTAPSETADAHRSYMDVESMVATLRAEPVLTGVSIGYVHGGLPADERAQAMDDFAQGRAPILVATTVIEVGVDVPEASMMVVWDAEVFGVSQLHQLRGRVGRGQIPSLCLLVHQAAPDSVAEERLNALADTTDGFALARTDFALRREGDVLGSAQSGTSSSLKLLDIRTHEDVIEDARTQARALVAQDPHIDRHPVLRAVTDEILGDRAGIFLERT